MKCNVENPANGKKSELHDKFLEIFQDPQAAEIAYAKVLGNSFAKRFGDWEFNHKNPMATDNEVYLHNTGVTIEEAIEVEGKTTKSVLKEVSNFRRMGEVNPKTGEPVLHLDTINDIWFFKDKDGERDPIDKYKFSEFTPQQVEEVTEHLLYNFVLQGGQKSYNQYDPSELEKGRIVASINRTIANYKEVIKDRENEAVLLERIELVEKNALDFKDELISAIDKLGVKVRERITDAEGNSVTEVADKDRGGGLNLKDSFETSSKETATVNTKIMLAQIEERVFAEAEDGTEYSVPVDNGFLEQPMFAKFDDVWNTLNKLLQDEVGHGYGDSTVDVFDVMYNKIDEMKDTKLWMHDLLDKLNTYVKEKNSNKITEFVQAFSKTEVNYFVTQVDGGKFSVINATSTNSRRSQLMNRWNNSFVSRFLGEKGQLASEERTLLANMQEDLLSSEKLWAQDAVNAGDPLERSDAYLDAVYEAAGQAAVDIVDILERMGATDINSDDVNRMIIMNGGEKKVEDTVNHLYKSINHIFKDILKSGHQFASEEGAFDNIFNKENSTRAFAEAVGWRMSDMADASVLLSQGKTGYTVTNPTYVSNTINEWKKDPSVLRALSMDVSKENSLWIRHLLALDEYTEDRQRISNERLDNLKAGLDASFTSKGKNDAVDNTSITTNDNINANAFQMLNGLLKKTNKSMFPTLIAADKSRRILLQGFDPIAFNMRTTEDGSIYVSPKAVDVAYGYFLDEYNRMRRVNQENKDDSIDKVVHYHGEDGNGIQSQIFPQFSKNNTDPAFQELRAAIYGKTFESDKYNGLSLDQQKIVHKFIEESISDRVKEHATKLDNLDGLSKELKDHYGDINGLAGDYFMNGLIASVEYTKMFSGDPAFYKNNADLIKRIPATYTDGLQLRLEDGDSLIFNQATVEGVEVASKYVANILASVTDKKIADAYKRVNTTDAQAWITPRRWRFLKQKLGQWGPQHDKVYDLMKTGGNMSPEQTKLAAQPLKGVYFEINQGRPVYLKYSQAVLIPSLVKGTPMEGLYNKMTKNPETGVEYRDGEAHLEIHEVITIDGVKVGAVAPTRINKEGTTDMLSEAEMTLNPKVLNNRGWKLQQDLPIKTMHETNVGSQIQKNIFEGLNLTEDYFINGEPINGSTLAQKIHDTVSKLSNIGKEDLKRKFAIDENGKINDKQYIYNALIEEFKDRGASENVVEALQKQTPLDAIPQIRGKVESIFMSIMNRKLTKITTEGGSFIQVSPFGLEKISEDSGIKIVSKNYNREGLLPPRIDKKTGAVLPGQAMIPHSQIMKILKANNISTKGKTLDELVSLLDPSSLELITYRIPNQGMSSNDYLEIVGILPPGMGDSIVVYDGLPAKTGSDFDIDKLFAMQNNLVYNTETKTVEKLTKENERFLVKSPGKDGYVKKDGTTVEEVVAKLYTESEVEKMITQNELVGQYKAVLNSPLTYDAMMRSIDGAQLKDDIVGKKGKDGKLKGGLFPAPVMKNMELFSPLVQLETKRDYLSGKMGVGQTANHLVDHVMNQSLNVRFDTWIGIGNKKEVTIKKGKRKGQKKTVTFFDSETTGKYSIADNLSAFLNAYVDIAKDPYISRANHNSITAGTTFMLLRAGASMEWVNRFIGQPILKELIALQEESMSITASDIMLKGDKGETSKGSALEAILERYGFNKLEFNSVSHADVISKMSSSALENNIKGERDQTLDYDVLAAWTFLQEQARFFGDGVTAAKSDTAGAGGSNVERLVNENKVKQVYLDKKLLGYEAKFQGTMLGTYRENTLNWVKDTIRSSDLFLSGTQGAMDTYNNVSHETGNGELLTDLKLAKAIDGAFYSYTMSGLTLFQDNNKDYDELSRGIPTKVMERQAEIVEGTADRNYLIEELEVSTWRDNKYMGINNQNKPTYYQTQIYRGWLDLYNKHYTNEDGTIDTETVHPDKKLAIDLARYAFLSSGFQNNLSQFFSFIPHQILKDFNVSSEIREAIRNADQMPSDSNFADQIQRHSKNNSKIVKSLNVDNMDGGRNVFIYKPAKNKSQEFGSSDGFFPKFVNGRFSDYINGWTVSSDFLYERKGTVIRKDADGLDIRVPVYARTFELGSSKGKFKSIEYSKGNMVTESSIPSNNINSAVEAEIEKRMDDVMMKEESFKDNNGSKFDELSVDNVAETRSSDASIIKQNLSQIISDKNIKCK